MKRGCILAVNVSAKQEKTLEKPVADELLSTVD
jgi:hypothetical protein